MNKNFKSLINEINFELNKNIDLKFKEGSINFFKEKINPLGVRTAIVKKIASKFYSKYKKEFSISNWIEFSEFLWQQKINSSKIPCMEYGMIIVAILRRQTKLMTKKDFYIFEKWINKYITNWAHCDLFCSGVVGEVIRKYPELTIETLKWTKSNNRWVKRASAVSYIKLSKEKKFLPIIFKTADFLKNDSNDLVQKGYGWMLKDASKNYKKEVIEYLLTNRDMSKNSKSSFDHAQKSKRISDMPRIGLRYACERLSKEEKQKIMY